MTDAMTFRGFSARVDHNTDDGVFTGRLAGIGDIVGFHADTAEGLRQAFEEAVDDYTESCARIGKDPQIA